MSTQHGRTPAAGTSTSARARRLAAPLMEAVERRPWLAAWLSLLPFVALRAGTFAESDTFWQIRTGLITMSDHSIPSRDPFSWTAQGEPWTQNSWGFNVLLAAIYRVGGLPAVAIACIAFTAGVLALALLLARKLDAHPFVAAVMLQAACSVLMLYLQARPQVFDYAAVLTLLLLLGVIIKGNGVPLAEIAAIGAVVVVWVNLHAAAPFGVGIIGTAAVLAALNRPTRHRAVWLLAACAVAALAALVNPYGFDVYTQAVQVHDASTTFITEWQRLDFLSPLQLAAFLPGVVALVIAVRRRDVVYTAALIVSAAGSIAAMRILPLLALTAFPILASAATNPTVMRYVASRRAMLTQGAVVFLGLVIVLGGLALTHAGRPDPSAFSPTVVAAIPRDCDVLNAYDYGGYLILKRQDLRVSIDSRNDMYGVDRLRDYIRVMKSRPGPEVAEAGCVLIKPTAPLAKWLNRDPEWRKTASAKSAVLYVRAS